MKKFIILIIIIIAVAAGIGWHVFTSTGGSLGFSSLTGGETNSAEVRSDIAIEIHNISDYPVAHGVLVVHDDNFSLNFNGSISDGAFELISEVGNADEALEYVEGMRGVHSAIITEIFHPGDQASYPLAGSGNLGAKVSFLGMVVPTNDAVILLDAVDVYGEDGELGGIRSFGQILDMGFEENSPIGSGFEGGQPDPSRGEENLDNGVELREEVSTHSQFSGELENNYILVFNLQG